jgi:predicted nucleic acid-binding Zn ribbon protein
VPIYSYKCKCGNVFDVFHTSFGAAAEAEADGVKCSKCAKPAARNSTPDESMKGGAFRKYGLYTYH